jgi:serine/threonine-protein kinase
MAASSPSSRRLPRLAKYEVLEEIGHGGMATVYRAHDKRLGRDVAVKVIHPHLRDSAEVAHRFFVEAKAVAKLRHANIVEVYDVSSEGEAEQYLVCELLRGKTLRKLLQEHGAIPPEVAAALALELLDALAHAHEAGVVHRDVKPENVILEQREKKIGVKLTDFGIAKLLDAKGVTSTGQVLGSPAHMAPEQIEGGEVDARADVFGLGVLLYECVVGHLPFEGNNPAQVLRRVLDGVYPAAEREKPEVGRRWSALVDRALAREPKDRFADARAMREAIAGEIERLDVGAPHALLEAWFADPAGFGEIRATKMIGRLCDLGSAARKAGDALGAAADYNRALAYAPTDPVLLKIVASMHRAEARARLAKKLWPMALFAAALGIGAFFVTRALKPHWSHGIASDAGALTIEHHPNPLVSFRPPPIIASTPLNEPSAEPVASARPVVVVPPIRLAVAPSAHPSATIPHRRTITLDRVFPIGGILVALDGDKLDDGARAIDVDDAPHKLAFSCVDDMCVPSGFDVEAGDKPMIVPIKLQIRDAKLVVVGDPLKKYRIKERPSVGEVISGAPVSIPMPSGGTDSVTVLELETGREARTPIKAGSEKRFVFPESLP